MAWSSKVDATQLTSITTEQVFQFSGDPQITLNPGESAHVAVDYNPVASPTDYLNVKVYASLDGTNYDNQPYMSFQVEKTPDPCQASFIVSGVYSFQIGVSRSGTTDTITSADCSYRKDGISI
jgi:hypothetical protein